METAKKFWSDRLKQWTGLDLTDRLSEVLFGLIMVLTFTGTISVTTAGRQEVDQLLWAALGCNLAWGLVDGIMYLMDQVLGRTHIMAEMKRLRKTKDPANARAIIRDNIPPLYSSLMDDREIDDLGAKLDKLPEATVKNSLTSKDFLVAVQVFFLVFLSTFPVALPFIFIQDVALALRISNGIGLISLFAVGYSLALYSGLRPFITATIYMAIGAFLVFLTIVLGG